MYEAYIYKFSLLIVKDQYYYCSSSPAIHPSYFYYFCSPYINDQTKSTRANKILNKGQGLVRDEVCICFKGSMPPGREHPYKFSYHIYMTIVRLEMVWITKAFKRQLFQPYLSMMKCLILYKKKYSKNLHLKFPFFKSNEQYQYCSINVK